MPQVRPVFTTYVFLDVVDFSRRPVEVQADIVKDLNGVVGEALARRPDIPRDKTILIPTGDGICVALQANEGMSFDVHMWLAVDIVAMIRARSQSAEEPDRKFSVRVGVNSNNDVEVIDVNGNRNMAGAGINMAQRVMSLADGDQIVVGQTVYNLLRDYKDYPPEAFRRFDTTVKHDEPLTVYQYVEHKHAPTGLNTDIPSALQAPDLRGAGRQCGLLNIYPSRNEQVYRDLRLDIERARGRVWMCGVGLSVVVRLVDPLQLLKEKSGTRDEDGRKLKIRLMLLDAISSPAVFRTFLESDNREFEEFLEAGRHEHSRPNQEHPYFKHQLFQHFKMAYNKLERMEEFQDAVRFPAHNPNCWLMVIDDTAYFQPYTFGGQVSNRQGSFTIGHLMPVFKFRAGAREDIFSLLVDHFDKLWQTTDTDLFHVGARVANGDRLIRRIFRGRSAWFKNVYGALYPAKERLEKGGKERVYPRQICRSPDRRIEVTWEIDGRAQRVTYPIANFARGGVLLEVEDNHLYPDLGKVADLQIVRKPKSDEVEDEPAMSKYLKEKLIDPSEGKFVVLRIDRRHDEQRERSGKNPIRTYVALRANEKDG